MCRWKMAAERKRARMEVAQRRTGGQLGQAICMERGRKEGRREGWRDGCREAPRYFCVRRTSSLPELNYWIDTQRGNFIMSYRCLRGTKEGDDACCHLTWHGLHSSHTNKKQLDCRFHYSLITNTVLKPRGNTGKVESKEGVFWLL